MYRILRGGEVWVKEAHDQTYRLKLGDLLGIPRSAWRKTRTEQAHIPAVEFPIIYEDDALLASTSHRGAVMAAAA
jgi:23S rRNA pseudouridine955/2504/2580 synthase